MQNVKIFTLLDKRFAFLIEALSLFSFSELLLLLLLLSKRARMKNECQINNEKFFVEKEQSLPREIFTPLNSKTVQLGHDSDSEVYPVKSLPSETRSLFSNDKSHFTGAYFTGGILAFMLHSSE